MSITVAYCSCNSLAFSSVYQFSCISLLVLLTIIICELTLHLNVDIHSEKLIIFIQSLIMRGISEVNEYSHLTSKIFMIIIGLLWCTFKPICNMKAVYRDVCLSPLSYMCCFPCHQRKVVHALSSPNALVPDLLK